MLRAILSYSITKTQSAALILIVISSLAIIELWDHDTRSSYDSKDGLLFRPNLAEEVALRISQTTHYALDTEEGALEWARLIPASGHIVHMSDSSSGRIEEFTVTLFHQLKCLDIIREHYAASPEQPPTQYLHHCFNYLRQMIWCRPNLWLESAKNTQGSASRPYDAVCHDWTMVYEEARRNNDAYVAWRSTNGTIPDRRG